MASLQSLLIAVLAVLVGSLVGAIHGLRSISAHLEVCQINRHLKQPPTYEISDVIKPGTIIFAANYWPRDAIVKPGGISGVAASFLRFSFRYDMPNNGIVRVLTNGTVQLPPYPSQLQETYLTVDMLCNGNMYALAFLRIRATNRHPPTFLGLPYTITIPEDTAVNSLIRTPVICIDWDPAPAYSVTYGLQVDEAEETFRLEVPWNEHYTASQLRAKTGVQATNWNDAYLPKVVYLRLLKALDFEYGRRNFRLYITAKDNLFNKFTIRSATVDLFVNVADIDDMKPTFSSVKYQANISQDFPVGATLPLFPKLLAFDGDPQLDSPLLYSIPKNNSYFKIDNETGVVSLVRPLPSVQKPTTYRMIVKAHQVNDLTQSATATVLIHQSNVKSTKQLPTPCYMNVEVRGNVPNGSVILEARPLQPKQAEYFSLTGPDASLFDMDPITGNMYVSNDLRLQRHQRTPLKVEVSYSDSINGFHVVNSTVQKPCSSATVSIVLKPVVTCLAFTQNQYNFIVSDLVKLNMTVGQIFFAESSMNTTGNVYVSTRNSSQFGVAFEAISTSDGTVDIRVTDVRKTISFHGFILQLNLSTDCSGSASPQPVAEVRLEMNSLLIAPTDDRNPVTTVTFPADVPRFFPIIRIRPKTSMVRIITIPSCNAFQLNATSGQLVVSDPSKLLYCPAAFSILLAEEEFNSNTGDVASVAELHQMSAHIFHSNQTRWSNAIRYGLIGFPRSIVCALRNDERTPPNRFQKVKKDGGRAIASFSSSGRSGRQKTHGQLDAAPDTNADWLLEDGDEYENDAPYELEETAPNCTDSSRFFNLPQVLNVDVDLLIGSTVYYVTAANVTGYAQLKITNTGSRDLFLIDGNFVLLNVSSRDSILNTCHRLNIILQENNSSYESFLVICFSNNETADIKITWYDFKLAAADLRLGTYIGSLATSAEDSGKTTTFDVVCSSCPFVADDTGHLYVSNVTSDGSAAEEYAFMVIETAGTDTQTARHYVIVEVLSDEQLRLQSQNLLFNMDDSTLSERRADHVEHYHANEVLQIVENTKPDRFYQVSEHNGSEVKAELAGGLEHFALNSTSGVVSVVKAFDYETTKQTSFNVSLCPHVEDGGGSGVQRRISCRVVNFTVNVLDQNDNAPLFDEEVYFADVPADVPVRSKVLQVHATDRDSGPNGDISYALTSASSTFAIDYASGWLVSTAALKSPGYNLTVVAFDHGRPPHTSSATVVIAVDSANQHVPEFAEFFYWAEIAEDAPVGTFVIQVNASDADQGQEGTLTYRLVPPSSDCFSINSLNGAVTTAASLDYERQQSYQLTIEVTDNGSYRRSARTLLVVSVVDVNDNAPVLQPLPDRIFISQAEEPGTVIFNVSADDADSAAQGNNNLTYSVENYDAPGLFEITPDTHQLVVKQRLRNGRFRVNIIVRDQGHPSLEVNHWVTVEVIAGNSMFPVFKQLQYHVDVNHCNSNSSLQRTFKALVPKGDVTYELIPEYRGLQINANSGEMLIYPEFCRYANASKMRLIIRATNSLNRAYYSDLTVTLVLSLQSNGSYPEHLRFLAPLYRAIVRENAPIGSEVGLSFSLTALQHSSKNVQLSYSLEPGRYFTVDQMGKISVRQAIDLEKLPASYHGVIIEKVSVTDGNSTAETVVEIKVGDENEFCPSFASERFAVTVFENCVPNTTIATVTARDGDFSDRSLRYSIVPSPTSRLVDVLPDGKIVKSEAEPFDRENGSKITFTVQATDHANCSGTAEVDVLILDVNDNSPEFLNTPYVWNVSEGPTGLGQSFHVAAEDKDAGDNGRVMFRITRGNSDQAFSITTLENNTAIVMVTRELDRESKATVFLLLEARDHGVPSLFSVTPVEVRVHDVNDNAPLLTASTTNASVQSDIDASTPIVILYAQDRDLNSEFEYSLEDPSGLFHIHPQFGYLTVFDRLPRRNATYVVVPKVSDGIFISEINVTIQVTSSSAQPKKEKTDDDHELIVFAEDSYEFVVEEGKNGTSVGKIDVNSSAPVIFSIFPENMNEHFKIGRKNGHITTTRRLQYTPIQSTYSFLVSAEVEDGSLMKNFVPVTVTVVDVNDHAPEFIQEHYFGVLFDDSQVDYVIPLNIKAIDKDDGINAKVKYFLNGSDAACFAIGHDTGRISLQCDLAHTRNKSFEFEVTAIDRNGAGKMASAKLSIVVVPRHLSVVDTPPNATQMPPPTSSNDSLDSVCNVAFSSTLVDVILVEHAPLSSPVFVATLSHGRKNCARVQFSLRSNSILPYFDINPNTGLISVAGDIDIRHLENEGLLHRQGSEGILLLNIAAEAHSLEGDKVQATMQVRVHVYSTEQSEDSGIAFLSANYSFSLEENEGPGTFVGQVFATSKRTYDIQYAVLYSQLFEIANSSLGIVTSTQRFDFEAAVQEYRFIVEASDLLQKTFASVSVRIEDVNDNAPVFSKGIYLLEIPEGPYGSGAIIGHVEASDKDSGDNGKVYYYMPDSQMPFNITEDGSIFAYGTIDREERDIYEFAVQATDGGQPALTSFAMVHIDIIDVNDNPPRFTQQSPTVNVTLRNAEEARVPILVSQIRATDSDHGKNGVVRYRIEPSQNSSLFTINSTEGTVWASFPDVAKISDSYVITVTAYDLGRPSLSTSFNMTVFVAFVDCSRPSLLHEFYTREVDSILPVNSTLITFPQETMCPRNFAITGRDDDQLFGMDSTLGQIYLKRQIRPQELNRTLNVSVTAFSVYSDKEFRTVVQFYIKEPPFMNPDDDALNTTIDRLFDSKHYSVNVMENLQPPVKLIDLNCTYEIERKPFYYVIRRGQFDRFHIDDKTGVITTLMPLDREQQSVYILVIACVKSRHRQPRELKANMNLLETVSVRTDEAVVIVKVNDVNDNPPTFAESRPKLVFPVETNTAPFPNYVGTVKAVDSDVNGKVTFSVVQRRDDDSALFSINRHNGEIRLRPKARDAMGARTKFTFTVRISDGVHESVKESVVFYLAPQAGITLTSSRSADVINSYRKTLEKKFRDLTKKEVIMGRADDLVLAQYNGSQIQVYGIDQATMDLVPQEEMARLTTDAFERIRKDLTHLKLIGIFSPFQETLDGSPWLSTPEISLIVVSSVVILLTCAMLCLFIRWCKRKEEKRISREYMIDTKPSGNEPYEEKHLGGMYWNSNEKS